MRILYVFALCFLSAVSTFARPTVTVGAKGEDGRPGLVTVETAYYKIAFDRVAQGSAVTAHRKPWDIDIRAEDFYGAALPLFNPFILQGDPDPKTGLVHPEAWGQSNPAQSRQNLVYADYEILEHTDNELVIEFSWQKRSRGAPAWQDKIIRRKRLHFHDDSPVIRVEFELENTDDTSHPVVAVFANAVAFPGVNVTTTAMLSDGLFRGLDAHGARRSSNIELPDIAGQFIGGVAETGFGVGYSYDWADLDAFKMDNYKQPGAGYLAFMGRRTIQPGETIVYPCTFMTFRDLPVLEGMTDDLAGGLNLEQASDAPSSLTVSLVSGSPRQVSASITCRRLEDDRVILDETKSIELAVAETKHLDLSPNFAEDGMYVINVIVDDGSGTVLKMERGVPVGETSMVWTPTPPSGEKRGEPDASKAFARRGMDKDDRNQAIEGFVRHAEGIRKQAERQRPEVIITQSREDAVYEIGDTVRFTISLAYDDGEPIQEEGTLIVNLTTEGWERLVEDERVQIGKDPVVVEYEVAEPGFIHLTTTLRDWDGERAFTRNLSVAAAEPYEIQPAVTMPDDFDEFWEKGRRRLGDIPLDYQKERVDLYSDQNHDMYKISFANINDTRIYGYLLIPRDGQEEYPALISVAPAGRNRPTPAFMDRLNNISTDQAICLYMSVYDHDLGRSPAYYRDYESKDGTPSTATEDPEAYFLRRAILGIDRAISWLAERPDVDSSRMVFSGGSQGGGMGLILAGLNQNITAVAAGIPALCDHLAFLDGRLPAWPGILGNRERRGMTDEHIEALKKMLPYFDAVNFARRIQAPVFISAGFLDTVCPPSGAYAAYNVITAPKKIVGDPGEAHNVSQETNALKLPWLRDKLGIGPVPAPEKPWE